MQNIKSEVWDINSQFEEEKSELRQKVAITLETKKQNCET